MKKFLNLTFAFVLTLLVFVILLDACAPGFSTRPIVDVQAEINTAVAATLVQYIIETKVASQAIGLVVEPAVQAAATENSNSNIDSDSGNSNSCAYAH